MKDSEKEKSKPLKSLKLNDSSLTPSLLLTKNIDKL